MNKLSKKINWLSDKYDGKIEEKFKEIINHLKIEL
jgi:hypothetical protein